MSTVRLTEDGLKHIAELLNLETLHLESSNMNLTDVGCEALTVLVHLQELILNAPSRLTDRGLLHISTLSQLRKLSLSGTCSRCRLDAGFQHLSNLKSLTALNLSYASITDKQLADLTPLLAALQELELKWCQKLTPVGFSSLTELKNLTHLNLEGDSLAPKVLGSVGRLQMLTYLNLSATAGMGLNHLRKLVNLRELDLNRSFASKEELRHVWTITSLVSLNLERIVHVHRASDLRGIEKLVNLRNLTLGKQFPGLKIVKMWLPNVTVN
jgi:hypothetical protein